MFDPVSFMSDPERRLTAEEALLVGCARAWPAPGKVEEALSCGLDWDYVMENAAHHRIAPLLHYNLEKVSPRIREDLGSPSARKQEDGWVPPRVMKALRGAYAEALGRSIIASRELKEVLDFLSDSHIQVIVLKGMALAETVYPDAGLRPLSDIDLLIAKEDQRKIEAKLPQLGYSLLYNRRPGFAQEFGYQFCYVKEEVSLDLHWHIAGPAYSKYIPVSSLWESAVPVSIGGVDTLVLSPENLLIHLCLHALKHNYSRLLWLVDISEVIHRCQAFWAKSLSKISLKPFPKACSEDRCGSLNWELFMETIQHYRIHPAICYTLRLVKKLLNPPMPDFALGSLDLYRRSSLRVQLPAYAGISRVTSFKERLLDVLADPGVTGIKEATAGFLTLDGTMPKPSFLEKSLSKKGVLGGVRPLARYLIGRFFPSRDFMLEVCPSRSIYSSYCLQGYSVLCRGLKTLLRTILDS